MLKRESTNIISNKIYLKNEETEANIGKIQIPYTHCYSDAFFIDICSKERRYMPSNTKKIVNLKHSGTCQTFFTTWAI